MRYNKMILLLAFMVTAAALTANAQPSRVQTDTARWVYYGGASLGEPCLPCRHTVPIDRTARPWGPTGDAHTYDPVLYMHRYAGGPQNYACLAQHGCGAQCDVYHSTAASVALEARVAAEVGVPWGELTPEEQLDAAYGYACRAVGGGGGGAGMTCADARPYNSTPRENLRCRYFMLGGRCWEWQGWSPPWPVCCPGASPCPPGGPQEEEPGPPPPVEPDPVETPRSPSACDAAVAAFRSALEDESSTPMSALSAAARAAEVCR